MDDDDRSGGLLAWQLRLYPQNHTSRANIVLHLITAPLFCVGTVLLAAAPFTRGWLAAVGGGLMLVTLAAQGRGHKGEAVGPRPFRGPLDFPARFFAEQWITFWRHLFAGGFAAAWRAAQRSSIATGQ